MTLKAYNIMDPYLLQTPWNKKDKNVVVYCLVRIEM